MSTYYRPTGTIPLEKVKELCKVTKVVPNEHSSHGEIFHDGTNYLHFATNSKGDVIDIFRYGGNSPGDILEELEDIFEVTMVSEYEEEYGDLTDPETPVITIHLGPDKISETHAEDLIKSEEE